MMTYLKVSLNAELEEGLRRFCQKNNYDFTVADVFGRNGCIDHRKALITLKEDEDEDVEEAIILGGIIDDAYLYNDFDCDAYNAIAAKMCPELLHPNGAVFYW